jgi:hypothetical protein
MGKYTKEEADRLARAGNHREAAIAYASLQLFGQAQHCMAYVEGDAMDRGITLERERVKS